MEEAASLTLLRGALDAVPDAVIVVDDAGTVVAANRAVEPVFGYRPADLEGLPVEVLVPLGARAAHPHRRTGYARRPMGHLQLSAVRRDGVVFPAEISLAPLEGGEPGLTVATVRDLTPQLAMQREADRMRDQLLATVTHELRTPLTAIVGYGELMAGLGTDEVGTHARRMLKVISRNAERELRLVNDLLTVAVGALGTMSLDLSAVDLATVATEVVDHRQEEARQRAVMVTLEAASGSSVIADRARVFQVLDNLLGNALKFTPAGGRVAVRLTALADSSVITLSDTGTGIAAEEQCHVFERLYRGRNATDDETQGAGLGLSIVQAIVEAHQGSVVLTSVEGEGTTITVQLPRTRQVTSSVWVDETDAWADGVRA